MSDPLNYNQVFASSWYLTNLANGVPNSTMKTTVNVTALLKIIRRNRAEHAKVFKAAETSYRRKAIAAMTKSLASAKAGKEIVRGLTLTAPRQYLHAYDSAIAMLEMNTEPTMAIDHDDFTRLARNRWEWARSFYASNSSYTKLAKFSEED